MPTKIWIVEEYGYANYIWEHPGTFDDVVADWKANKVPVDFWGLRDEHVYVGTCEQFDPHGDVWERIEDKLRNLGLDEMNENHPAVREAVAMLEVAQDHENIKQRYGLVATAHVHDVGDTWLKIADVTYGPWEGCSGLAGSGECPFARLACEPEGTP